METLDLVRFGFIPVGKAVPIDYSMTTEARLAALETYLRDCIGWHEFTVIAKREEFILRWCAYIVLPKESLDAYFNLADFIKGMMGEATFVDMRSYTNFLVRNEVMIRKGFKDRVSDTMLLER